MGTISSPPHFVIFPFMAYGHTIPLLYFARLLRRRQISVTIFTTPGNSPSIRSFLRDADISIVHLPFPENIDGVPPGVENTEKLPSITSFLPFATATKLMRRRFEQILETIQPISCIVSDAFLGWTQLAAAKLGIPRLVFFGMSSFSMTMYQILGRERPHAETTSLDQPFSIPGFPEWMLTRNDFESPFCDPEPEGPYVDFMVDNLSSMFQSHGVIVNSFKEVEEKYTNYWNQKIGPNAWCIGPLCLAEPIIAHEQKLDSADYIQWLDEKLANGESVLYVAFGTQAQISKEQMQEIGLGLEQSKVNFLWALRSDSDMLKGFMERVKDRGMIVKDWVDQIEILRHKSTKGFFSHCGWNSVLESICSRVPILALPLMADQHLNARLVVEEMGVGLRMMPDTGAVRGVVGAEEVEKKVKMLMEGEEGVVVMEKVKEVGGAAFRAMDEGGSSRKTLDLLICDACRK